MSVVDAKVKVAIGILLTHLTLAVMFRFYTSTLGLKKTLEALSFIL